MDIRSSLDSMPKTLDETYERALLAINGETRQYAQRLFQCLSVSIRPLRVEELADILAVRFDAGALPKFNPNWRLGNAEEAVLSVCSNLISVVDVDGSQVVQFSHFSVKEFLTSDRLATAMGDLSGYHIIPHSAHTILAQASLSVLLQLDDHIDRDGIENYPLSSYAAQHWVEHGQFVGVSSAIQVAMEHLFNLDKPHFTNWLWIYDMDDPWRGGMPTKRPERPGTAPLYYAVLCGFRQLIEYLIASYPGDVNARGGYYLSPLLAAFIIEDINIALSLLQRGADVNVLLDMSSRSPLHRVGEGGRIDIADLLLKHHADINLRNPSSGSVLVLASSKGEMEISSLLLQRGADVNFRTNEGFTSLHRAVQNGHLDVARYLLQSGADIGSRDNNGQTPLHAASSWGQVKIADFLVQHGADVSSHDDHDWTPLHAASRQGHVKIAELFIQHGADVTSRDTDGWTPLYAASRSGHVKVAELLIQHGSDVDSRDHNEVGLLCIAASFGGHVKLAELLIQYGIDVDSRTIVSWTPLHQASYWG
jgi:ankyrin repeat protein